MAETPRAELDFEDGCPDCGRREARLPEPLPPAGDDFDWLQRDYDSFRLAMLEELAARFPERRKWSPADMEVVLVETLAVVLDQLSDMLDRVQAEAFLETARRPESVRRLLGLIGFDPLREPDILRRVLKDVEPKALGLPADVDEVEPEHFEPEKTDHVVEATRALDRLWRDYPERMEDAKQRGPRAIHRQRRMVTAADYASGLERHPLVERAHADAVWTGSWTTLTLACLCAGNVTLDRTVEDIAGPGLPEPHALKEKVGEFHHANGIDLPDWDTAPTVRSLLREFLDAWRMAGQEVWLVDAIQVGILIDLSIRVRPEFYRSEVRRAALAALGRDVGGFFEPGRLRFGEDLHASDVIEAVMALDGVEAVCLNRFKRLGRRYADQSDAGRIRIDGIEVAICDNDPADPGRGVLRIQTHGGLAG